MGIVTRRTRKQAKTVDDQSSVEDNSVSHESEMSSHLRDVEARAQSFSTYTNTSQIDSALGSSSAMTDSLDGEQDVSETMQYLTANTSPAYMDVLPRHSRSTLTADDLERGVSGPPYTASDLQAYHSSEIGSEASDLDVRSAINKGEDESMVKTLRRSYGHNEAQAARNDDSMSKIVDNVDLLRNADGHQGYPNSNGLESDSGEDLSSQDHRDSHSHETSSGKGSLHGEFDHNTSTKQQTPVKQNARDHDEDDADKIALKSTNGYLVDDLALADVCGTRPMKRPSSASSLSSDLSELSSMSSLASGRSHKSASSTGSNTIRQLEACGREDGNEREQVISHALSLTKKWKKAWEVLNKRVRANIKKQERSRTAREQVMHTRKRR